MINEDFGWGFNIGIWLVIITLKLTKIITWSWWIILAPFYVPILIMLAAVIFFFVVIPVVASILK